MIVAVSSHPAQYRAPLYRYLSRRSATAIRAVYARDTHVRETYDRDFDAAFRWATDLLSGYEYQFINGNTKGGRTKFWRSLIRSFGTVRRALATAPIPRAVLLHSYATPEGLGGLLAAKATRVPALLMTESELLCARPLIKKTLRRLLLPPLLRLYDGMLYIGTQNRAFYQHYGVQEHRLFFTPYSVDNSGFLAELDHQLAARDTTRQEVGAGPSDQVLLFAGKLIPRKRPVDLVRAVATLDPRLRPFLIFVGSGPLASTIRETAVRTGVTKLVITGFKNADEIGRYYAAADAFALPSEFETWGLVVNEAMVHSLPTIVSDGCGCAVDLVADGATGYRFPPGDVSALADRIARVFQSDNQRRTMGARARMVMERWSFAEVETGVRSALESLEKRAAFSFPSKSR